MSESRLLRLGEQTVTEIPLAGAEPALTELRQGGFTGPVIFHASPDYEQHRRVWNGAIDLRPALIARCRNTDDAVAALRFARARGLELAVRGGGHSFPGHSTCDGGLVIDLGLMKRIAIDPQRRRARVQPGVLLSELDQATQRHGLIVPSGIVTHTGVAGLTLGGGIGWLQRKYGLTIDQLLAVDLIAADGERITADDHTNSGLFWGIRGAGANFGIVTEFEFQLQPLDTTVLAGLIVWDMRRSPQVMRFYRDWIETAPDELTTIVFHRRAPSQLGLDGQPVVMIGCCYAGPISDGERAIKPLRRFAEPLMDLCRPRAFLAHQAMLDATFAPGRHYYFRAHDTGPLTDELIDTLVEHALGIRSNHSASGSSTSAERSRRRARTTPRSQAAEPGTRSTSTRSPRPPTSFSTSASGRGVSRPSSPPTTPGCTSTS